MRSHTTEIRSAKKNVLHNWGGQEVGTCELQTLLQAEFHRKVKVLQAFPALRKTESTPCGVCSSSVRLTFPEFFGVGTSSSSNNNNYYYSSYYSYYSYCSYYYYCGYYYYCYYYCYYCYYSHYHYYHYYHYYHHSHNYTSNYTSLHYTHYIAAHNNHNYKYNYNCNCNYTYTTLSTLHYNYNCTTPHYIQQLCWGDHPCNHSKKHKSNHLSVHQWIRSAIRDSQKPTSPIGFLFLKLLPLPCAVLLVCV